MLLTVICGAIKAFHFGFAIGYSADVGASINLIEGILDQNGTINVNCWASYQNAVLD